MVTKAGVLFNAQNLHNPFDDEELKGSRFPLVSCYGYSDSFLKGDEIGCSREWGCEAYTAIPRTAYIIKNG